MESCTTERKLEALSRTAAEELERTEAISENWLPPLPTGNDTPYYNVVICGGGMSGLAIAFGLKRRGVDGVLIVDRNPKGREGPWVGCARMKTLRSPKYLTGPDFGIPSLTPRAWFEAVYGERAWAELGKMSRQDWMAYLDWYRAFTAPRIENRTELQAVDWNDGWLELTLGGDDELRRVRCRHLVLATGIDGGGGPSLPPFVREIPKRFWTHSADIADDSHLAGLDVAVLGSATSGFDWAVTALEKGAEKVTMIGRACDFGRTEVLAWTNFPGYLGHFAELPDIERWRFSKLYNSFQVPPTQDQFDRAVSHPNFTMQLGQIVRSVTVEGDKLHIRTDETALEVDHILLGTGYVQDLSLRPELQHIVPQVAFWRDRYTPPADQQSEDVANCPYLGSGFELMPKAPGEHDWLQRIHMFNCAALSSLGPVSNGVTGMKFGLPRIVDALTGRLFAEMTEDLMRDFAQYNEDHFDPRGYGSGRSGEECKK
ncbi:NAD(P)-binding domain-containing protein [Roseibium aggregatum]|uniref:Glutamate synthase subunit beta n=1 Tax=Roseibium aggregatum TaxID=187304 RepID=A0A0M6YD41_9HYPH|nr:NAD(P)/FAD-dependent oxidoreductase [Roseibium aggregatum]CTQ47423.1 glutamate synthase subunit beta [Roseibium aggregatum]